MNDNKLNKNIIPKFLSWVRFKVFDGDINVLHNKVMEECKDAIAEA